jgi:ATP synthase protein I
MTSDPSRGGQPPRVRDGGQQASPRRRAPLVPSAAGELSPGLNLTVEFLAAMLTWGGIGWLVDRWLGTEPWVLVAGLVVGNACGIYLIWLHSRTAEEVERARSRGAGSRREGDKGASG